jgi:hypothetical protein
MARTTPRPPPRHALTLPTAHTRCWHCGAPLWVAYHRHRTIQTLDGLVRLTLPVRRCPNRDCARYHLPYHPESEGHYALPHGEFGLDVIALVGRLRFVEHQSVPEIHRALVRRGVGIAERSVTEQLRRYEELVALRLADPDRLTRVLRAQGAVILALDGLQPDVGQEVLWVLRDCLGGEILLARSLLSGTAADIAGLIAAVRDALPVPITGVISDGQHPIRQAVARELPGVPHQLCQFHYLREAAKPIYEADRHAKTQLKKQVRGVRPIERALAERDDAEAVATRGYCLAVRGALTDDGRPPLCASGLRLHDRLAAITASIARVAVKRGCRRNCGDWIDCSRPRLPRPHRSGRRSDRRMRGSIGRRICSTTKRSGRDGRYAGSTARSSPRWCAISRRSGNCGGRSPRFSR